MLDSLLLVKPKYSLSELISGQNEADRSDRDMEASGKTLHRVSHTLSCTGRSSDWMVRSSGNAQDDTNF